MGSQNLGNPNQVRFGFSHWSPEPSPNQTTATLNVGSFCIQGLKCCLSNDILLHSCCATLCMPILCLIGLFVVPMACYLNRYYVHVKFVAMVLSCTSGYVIGQACKVIINRPKSSSCTRSSAWIQWCLAHPVRIQYTSHELPQILAPCSGPQREGGLWGLPTIQKDVIKYIEQSHHCASCIEGVV